MANINNVRMNEAFRLQKFLLTLTGTWPYENETFFYKLKFYFLNLMFILYGILLYAEVIINIDNVLNLSSLVILILVLMACVFKIIFFTYKRDSLLALVELLDDDIFYDHDVKLDVHVQRAVRLAKILLTVFGSGVMVSNLIYVALPLFTQSKYPTSLTMDFGGYETLIYAIQTIGSFNYSLNYIGGDYLCISMIILGVSQFDVLKGKIMAIRVLENDCRTENEIKKKLRNIVQHHQALIRYLKMFEDIFSACFFLQALVGVPSITFIMFSIVVLPPTTLNFLATVILFFLMMMHTYAYCYFCDNLMTNGLEICGACYSIGWYNCSRSVNKTLLIIMIRSQIPLNITLMQFAALSMELFAIIIRTSYSYVTVLLHMANVNNES